MMTSWIPGTSGLPCSPSHARGGMLHNLTTEVKTDAVAGRVLPTLSLGKELRSATFLTLYQRAVKRG